MTQSADDLSNAWAFFSPNSPSAGFECVLAINKSVVGYIGRGSIQLMAYQLESGELILQLRQSRKKTAAKCDVTGDIDRRPGQEAAIIHRFDGFRSIFRQGQEQRMDATSARGLWCPTRDVRVEKMLMDSGGGSRGDGGGRGKNLHCKYNHESNKAKRGVRSCRARLEGRDQDQRDGRGAR